MNKPIPMLALLLMGIPFSVSLATTEESLATSTDPQIQTDLVSSEHTSVTSTGSQKTKASAPIFGIGKPKYKQRRVQRQNSVDNTNRRARRNQRKNGIGMLPVAIWKEVNLG